MSQFQQQQIPETSCSEISGKIMQFHQQPEQIPCFVIGGKIIDHTFIIPSFKDDKEEEECRRIFSIFSKSIVAKYSRFTKITYSDIMTLGRELYDLSLPRPIQLGSSFSKHTIMLTFTGRIPYDCGVMAFAFDADQSTLYHVVTKERNHFHGCVAVQDSLYFIGGHFDIHEYRFAFEEAFDSLAPSLREIDDIDLGHQMLEDASKDMLKNKLEVPTFNLRTGKWEDITKVTKLNAPKRGPLVFTFERKIYALAAKIHVDHSDRFSSFEFLDTTISSESPTTWTYLPAPPFIATRCPCYILWKEKKWLLVKISDVPDDRLEESLWKFDLVSQKWCSNTTDSSSSYYDPHASEFLSSLSDVPASHFHSGCIVRDILFCFQDSRTIHEKQRLVVGHDLRGQKAILCRWEIDLKDLLWDVGRHGRSSSPSCLHHLEGFTFCLAINYSPSHALPFNFLCTLKFSLGWGEAIESEAEVNPICIYRKFFQMPNMTKLNSHTKLETWD